MPPGQEGLFGDFLGGQVDALASALTLRRLGSSCAYNPFSLCIRFLIPSILPSQVWQEPE